MKIQDVLDQIAREVESEMERERVLWSLEEINYENMVSFYETAIVEQKKQDRKSKDKVRRIAEEEALLQQEQLTLQEQQLDDLLSMMNSAAAVTGDLKSTYINAINANEEEKFLTSMTTTKITMHRHDSSASDVTTAVDSSALPQASSSIGSTYTVSNDDDVTTVNTKQSESSSFKQSPTTSTTSTNSVSANSLSKSKNAMKPSSTYKEEEDRNMMNDLLSCRSGDSVSETITNRKVTAKSATRRAILESSLLGMKPVTLQSNDEEEEEEEEEDDDVSSNLLSFQKFLQWDFVKVCLFSMIPLYV